MVESQNEKRHAACDGCRNRKLKCSRDFPVCERCREEGAQCTYSPQKRMGRPRKRARNEDEAEAEVSHSTGRPDVSSSESTEFTSPETLNLDSSFQSGTPRLDIDDLSFLQDSELPAYNPTLQISTGVAETIHQLSDNTIPLGPCACLSTMFLTLSSLQGQTAFDFPQCIPALRSSIHTTNDVLQCEQCPKQVSSAMQNIMLLTTLLTSITDCYRKLLVSIDAEAALATSSGTKKPFRMGDNSPQRAHLHTGTPDCPMGFNIDLDGDEWRLLARKVVKADVEGSGSGGNASSVLGLADLLEERQIRWHSSPEMCAMREHYTNGASEQCVPQEEGFSCLRMVKMVRHHVELLRL